MSRDLFVIGLSARFRWKFRSALRGGQSVKFNFGFSVTPECGKEKKVKNAQG